MKIKFAVIGGQKSGSTYIQSVLSAHPQVFMPEDEVPYFEDPDFQEGGMQKLEALFENVSNELVWGIKRPNLLGSSQYASRLKQNLGQIKLIVILRDPVIRAVSAYYHYMKDGFLPPLTLSEGMNNILEGKMEGYGRHSEIIEFGLYYKHLKHYHKYFSQDQILILLYDELKKNKKEVIKKLYRFIGVDEGYNPEQVIDKTPQKVIYSIPRQSFISLSNQFKYSYNADKTRCFKKKQHLGDFLACKLIRGVDKLIMARIFSNKKPPISKELHSSLYAQFREDIEHLEIFLQRDLSSWKFQLPKTAEFS
ncbi:sulfotransferase domain-containing protein [Catalinimonas sp. 4WD22]|uniref:sulfotransferase domain-containing protein n=1 Tax=Catalinimonas locisalis TaxID=3133978 RepID=UPI0031012176